MARGPSSTKLLVISAVIVLCAPTGSPAEEEGSLFEFAESLLQESVRNQNGNSGLNMLSGLVQGFMQTEGGKQLGDMLTKSKGGSVDIVSNLASIWQASKFNFATTDETGSKRDLNIDPSILGSMMDLFSSLNQVSSEADNNNMDENNNDREGRLQKEKEPSVDWSSLLSVAGSVMSAMGNPNQENDDKGPVSSGGLEFLFSFLPVLMNSLSGHHNPHVSRSIPHHTHSPFLPPFFENLHEYWDHFSNSEFGKTLWQSSGLSELVNIFTNDNGELQMEKVLESLENNTFRRQWIKSIASFLAQWSKHFTNPEIQNRFSHFPDIIYLKTGQIICNSFLSAQGYPKEALVDLNKPAKSISTLINTVFHKQFNLNVNSETYIGPAISYIQELFKIGQKKGFGMLHLSSEDIESKLSETMDSDMIEPILRTNRAYKFSLKRPECAKYVICVINQNNDVTKSGLKPGITKLSSLGAAWFISTREKIGFWELYEAAVGRKECTKYDQQCYEFHEEDIKATTEYYHNEL